MASLRTTVKSLTLLETESEQSSQLMSQLFQFFLFLITFFSSWWLRICPLSYMALEICTWSSFHFCDLLQYGKSSQSVTLHQINPNAWIVCPRFLISLHLCFLTRLHRNPNTQTCTYFACILIDWRFCPLGTFFVFLFLFCRGCALFTPFGQSFEPCFPLLIAICRIGYRSKAGISYTYQYKPRVL